MTLLYSGGAKHERGVGFIVNDKIVPNMVYFKLISNWLCLIELKLCGQHGHDKLLRVNKRQKQIHKECLLWWVGNAT